MRPTDNTQPKNTKNSWNKHTIEWIINNRQRVFNWASYQLGLKTEITSTLEIDELVTDIYYHFYKASDYAHTKSIRTIEQYINGGIRICIKRYLANKYTNENNYLSIDLFSDNSGVSYYDNYAQDILDGITLTEIQDRRYRLGIDIFLLVYLVRNTDRPLSVLTELGIALPKRQQIITDPDITFLMQQDLNTLREMVYCVKHIDAVIRRVDN